MINFEIWGNKMTFLTDESLFSPHMIDKGTQEMLNCVSPDVEGRILDLGCGYGVVGISFAKANPQNEHNIVLVDNNKKAAAFAKQNAVQNGVPDVSVVLGEGWNVVAEGGFSLVLSNPPYHTDFSVPKRFIESAYRGLVLGGRLVVVVKRLDWYKNKMNTVFGGIQILDRNGYFVLISEKRPAKPKPVEKPTTKKHRKKIKKQTGE